LLDPENNAIVLDLLFELATWHGLAKLRLHTESTLSVLEASTSWLGVALRKFSSTTCEAFDTRELPSEEAARGRRNARMAMKKAPLLSSRAKGKQRQGLGTNVGRGAQQQRKFSLDTYKLHALGDYVAMIRLYGTSDGISSQTVIILLYSCELDLNHSQGELEHHRCKRYFPLVHKGLKHYAKGIANHISRERLLNNLSAQLNVQPEERSSKKRKVNPTPSTAISPEIIGPARPTDRYQISNDTRNPLKLNIFLRTHDNDPSVKVLINLVITLWPR
jgi:hypothetical protein